MNTDTNHGPLGQDTIREDIIRRGIKRTLPVKLDRDELLEISIAKSKKEQLVAQLEEDLSVEMKKRKDQIKEAEDEIKAMGRELVTGHQDRVVPCNEVFRSGMVFVIRTDDQRVVEKRPANAQEAQRYLPAVENSAPPANVLDQARAKQANGAAAAQKANGVSETEDGDVVPPDGAAPSKKKRSKKAKS